MKEGRAALFCSYIRQQLHRLLIFAAEILIFLAVFSLYRIGTEAVLYAGGLCLLLKAVIFLIGFFRFRRDHTLRLRLKNAEDLTPEDLPEPRTPEAREEREIAEELSKQVRELEDLMREREQDLSDYYTVWVHQIKTPISALHMLLDDAKEYTEAYHDMKAELFRIEQYANMALSYVRLESGSHDLVLHEIRPDPVIREVIRKFAPQMIAKRLRLLYEPAEISLVSDEKWLAFMLEQLLSNAVKYTVRGSIGIRLTEDRKLTVSDTGIGIAPEDLPLIFERGFTGYNGRADKRATGLGLYLVKRAADRLSVGVRAESEPGKGSVFTLVFPKENPEIE